MNVVRRSVWTDNTRILEFGRRSFNSMKLPVESLDSSNSPCLLHGIHVFHCPDEVGIVSKLSECIASRGGNILSADVFVPENRNVFYSRSEFIFDPAKWSRVQKKEDFSKVSSMFKALCTSAYAGPQIQDFHSGLKAGKSRAFVCVFTVLEGHFVMLLSYARSKSPTKGGSFSISSSTEVGASIIILLSHGVIAAFLLASLGNLAFKAASACRAL